MDTTLFVRWHAVASTTAEWYEKKSATFLDHRWRHGSEGNKPDNPCDVPGVYP